MQTQWSLPGLQTDQGGHLAALLVSLQGLEVSLSLKCKSSATECDLKEMMISRSSEIIVTQQTKHFSWCVNSALQRIVQFCTMALLKNILNQFFASTDAVAL